MANPVRTSARAPGGQLHLVRARDVIPRGASGRRRRLRQPLPVGQPDDLDVDHGYASTDATSTSGRPNASATPGYTTLPCTTFRPSRSAPSALQASFHPMRASFIP